MTFTMRNALLTLLPLLFTSWFTPSCTALDIFRQGFESGLANWTVEGGLWEAGPPKAANGPAAFAGTNVVGTGLTRNYGSTYDTRLITPEFQVPAATESPRFTYHYWYLIGANDYGQLQIRTTGGEWQDLPGERLTEASGGSWARRSVDLRSYAGQTIQVGFRFFARANNSAGDFALGWFIDDAALETGPMTLESPQTFENGLGDWSVEGGLWQVGPPTAAAGPKAFQGTNVAGTILAGNYGTTHDARLVTPEFIVPAASEAPRFTYYYWYALGTGDYGQLQVRAAGSSSWQDVAGEKLTDASGGSWARRSVDLRTFAGQTIQLGFRLVSTYDNRGGDFALGWYIDQAALETGPMKLAAPEDFEHGFGDWSVEGGLWQVGIPSGAGAPTVFEGQNLAGTILAGNYGTVHDARLVSPEIVVPEAGQAPRFTYNYWYAIGTGDYGQAQIREAGGTWQDIAGERLTESSGGAWARRSIDLRAWAGKNVQIAFRLVTTYDNRAGDFARGWYIDRAALETGPQVLSSPEGFENGFGDWSAEGGLWQVGTPSGAGAPSPWAGQRVAGTILSGNYGTTHDARLISPEFTVPSAGQSPRFSYYYWYDLGFLDSGRLQIRPVGGEWQDVAGEQILDRGLAWARRVVDFRAWAGQTIQIAFHFVSGYENRGGDLGLGWYIDEINLETGPARFNPLEGFENGFGNWSAEGGVWQIGSPSGAGAPPPFGTNLAGTILAGNYPNNADARLVTPEFIVPPASRAPQLSFQHWRALSGADRGRLEISRQGGAWSPLSDYFTGNDLTWKQTAFDLSAVAGQPVRIAWHLTTDASFVNRGWYIDNVQLGALDPIVLNLGATNRGTLLATGARALYVMEVPPGGHFRLTLDDLDNTGANTVYVRRGAVPTTGEYDYRSRTFSPDQSIFAADAGSGPWFVLIVGASVPTNGSPYQVRADFFPGVFLTDVKPTLAGNAFPFVLDLSGAGFDSTVQVDLRSSGTVLATGSATVITSSRMQAKFEAIPNVPPGTYQVTVTKGTNSLALPIDLVAGGIPHLETQLIIPGQVGRHAPGTIIVEYANTGTAAMPAPLLILKASDRALLTMSSSAGARGLWTAIKPTGFSDSMQFLASGATPGILQPGERRRIPIYYAGLLRPWNFARFSVGFDLGVVDSSNTAAVDWNSLKSLLRPETISLEGWEVVWANFLGSVGSTWGSFATRLVEDAEALGKLGLNVTDVGELLAYELIQADGLNPLHALAEATDAALAQPGVPLILSRYYPQAPSQRFRSGPFGRGWRHNWEFKLRAAADGSISVATPTGGRRAFEPDSRGGFFSQPGDSGKLTSLGLGRYELREKTGVRSVFRGDGLLEFIEDLNRNRVTASYNPDQTLKSLAHTSGESLQFEYGDGLLQKVIDSYGRMTSFTYDGARHLTSVSPPDGTTTTYRYSSGAGAAREHALTEITFPAGRQNLFTYDPQGRLATMSRNAGSGQLTFTYDSARAVVMTDAENNAARFYFDQRGMPARLETADGAQARFTVDQNFRLTALEGNDLSPMRFSFDGQGNLTRVLDPNGRGTTLTYGPNARPTSLTDPRNQKTLFTHDARGNLTGMTFADQSQRLFAYDESGTVTNFVNRRGGSTAFLRDGSGRLTRKVSPDGRAIDYNYDARGNLTNVNDSARGPITMEYDSHNLVTRVTHPDGRGFAFQYDVAGRRTIRTSHDGHTLKYFYDPAGRLEHLEDGSGNTLIQYQYDASGRVNRENKGNGTWTTYEYTATGLLTRLINYGTNGVPASQFDYVFDRAGRCTAISTLAGTTTYKYDAANQLIEAGFADNSRITYTYDAAGNRVLANENGTNVTYVSNNLNQYTQKGTATFAYDQDGNLTTRNDAAGTTTYEYDGENRLIRLTIPGKGTWDYTYDGLGQRVAAAHDGAATHYLYDLNGSASLTAEYTDAGALIARYESGTGLISRTDAAGHAAYYNFDALGNTREMVDAQGKTVNRYDYQPFGGTLGIEEALPNPFTYAARAGVMRDGSGLQHMRVRTYAPDLGRFMQVDPQGLRVSRNPSVYTYVSNNPVTRLDSVGLEEEEPLIHWQPFEGQGDKDYNKISDDLKGIDLGITILDPWMALRGGYDGFRAVMNKVGLVLSARDALYYGSKGGLRGAYEQVKFVTLLIPQLALDAIFPQGAPLIGAGISLIGETVFEVWTDIIGNIYFYIGQGLGWLSDHIPWDKIRSLFNKIAAAFDPNELIGPAGYGPSNYVAAGSTLAYRINFENATNATAPAQMVVITNALPADLDLATLEFQSIGFGDYFFSIPPGSQSYEHTERVTFAGTEFDVNLEAKIDYVNRQLLVKYDSVIPDTGLPPEVNIGFLPPEDGTGRGDGHFSYTVQAKSGLTTGTAIRNIGLITFDPFAGGPTFRTDLTDPRDPTSSPTPDRQALVTIDADSPTSTVDPLPAASSAAEITVHWSGHDAGAGVTAYDIYVRTDEGAWLLWQEQTPSTSGVWNGAPGHTYGFYAVATDGSGLSQSAPTPASAPQASTAVAGAINFFRAARVVPQGIDLEFFGSPRDEWIIQRASSLPGPWVDLPSVTVDDSGSAHLVDSPPPGNAFYRALRK